MNTAGKRKRTYDTYHRIRLALFVRSYVGYSIANHLRIKYKIDDKLTKSQLHQKFSNKRAIPEISKLSKVLIMDYQQLWQFMVLGKSKKLNTKVNSQMKIKAYLAIEKEIITLKTERQDKENIIHEDYERALLSPALERAAGNNLNKIKDDQVFEIQLEELRKRYQRWYYDIAHEYKLPTW
jgi:hypothetical protein